MSRKLTFAASAWNEYLEWQSEDKKTLKRTNRLLKEILRTPFDGIGNPEPLKNDLAGYWSREIDDKNRIVFEPLMTEDTRFLLRQPSLAKSLVLHDFHRRIFPQFLRYLYNSTLLPYIFYPEKDGCLVIAYCLFLPETPYI